MIWVVAGVFVLSGIEVDGCALGPDKCYQFNGVNCDNTFDDPDCWSPSGVPSNSESVGTDCTVAIDGVTLTVDAPSETGGLDLPSEEECGFRHTLTIDQSVLTVYGDLTVYENGTLECDGTGGRSSLIVAGGALVEVFGDGVVVDNCGMWTIAGESSETPGRLEMRPDSVGMFGSGSSAGPDASIMENMELDFPGGEWTFEGLVELTNTSILVRNGQVSFTGRVVETTVQDAVMTQGQLLLKSGDWERVDDVSNPLVVSGGSLVMWNGFNLDSHLMINGTADLLLEDDGPGSSPVVFDYPVTLGSSTAELYMDATLDPSFTQGLTALAGRIQGTSSVSGSVVGGEAGPIVLIPYNGESDVVGDLSFSSLQLRTGTHQFTLLVDNSTSYSRVDMGTFTLDPGAEVTLELLLVGSIGAGDLSGATLELVNWTSTNVVENPFETDTDLIDPYCPGAWLQFEAASGVVLNCFPDPNASDEDDSGTEENDEMDEGDSEDDGDAAAALNQLRVIAAIGGVFVALGVFAAVFGTGSGSKDEDDVQRRSSTGGSQIMSRTMSTGGSKRQAPGGSGLIYQKPSSP